MKSPGGGPEHLMTITTYLQDPEFRLGIPSGSGDAFMSFELAGFSGRVRDRCRLSRVSQKENSHLVDQAREDEPWHGSTGSQVNRKRKHGMYCEEMCSFEVICLW